MNELELKRHLLSCPGDTIQEQIDFIGMSQAELAKRMGRSVQKLNELIKGKASLTADTALKLEYVLDIPVSFWLELEAKYQSELLEIEKMEIFAQNKEWLKGFPLSFLQKIGVISSSVSEANLVEELLKFFRVASPNEWENIYKDSCLAFKIASQFTKEAKAISTWLRLGELQAANIELHDFDQKLLTEAMPKFQEICYHNDDNWLEQLQSTCASAGIALVYTPSIPKAPIYGASRWIKNKKTPLIQLTDRGKDYNSFWFSFYHELAHIRLHKKSESFVSSTSKIVQDKTKEKEADDFAIKQLFPNDKQKEVEKMSPYTPASIMQLGEKMSIHPSIIVSQLQREKKVAYNNVDFNKLKVRVEFNNLVLT
ncbi:MAG: HigA family addiction module antidote protein [Fibrobacter sp.]|nr:HigA family addiction module antidote protein [Fibrobacter sp.]